MNSVPRDSDAPISKYGANERECQITFKASGETLRIVSTLPEMLSAIRELGYEEQDSGRGGAAERIYRVSSELRSTERLIIVQHEDVVVFRASDKQSVLRYLVGQVRNFMFRRKAGDLHVHAGAVSFQGLGIMLPGESRSGKSTLTLALLLRGCQYLSDELAVVERDTFRLMPSKGHLSLRRPTYSLFPEFEESLLVRTYRVQPYSEEKAFLPLDIVGEGVLSAPCTLGLIVFPNFRRDSRLCLEALDRGTAARKLLSVCCNLRWETKVVIEVTLDVVNRIDCFSLIFGDAYEAADCIVQLASRYACSEVRT